MGSDSLMQLGGKMGSTHTLDLARTDEVKMKMVVVAGHTSGSLCDGMIPSFGESPPTPSLVYAFLREPITP